MSAPLATAYREETRRIGTATPRRTERPKGAEFPQDRGRLPVAPRTSFRRSLSSARGRTVRAADAGRSFLEPQLRQARNQFRQVQVKPDGHFSASFALAAPQAGTPADHGLPCDCLSYERC